MTEFIREEGSTVEEAIERALDSLKAEREDVDVAILREPSKGFLGIGAEAALVEVSLKNAAEHVAGDRPKEALRLVGEIVSALGLASPIEISERDNQILISVEAGERAGLLIGKKGETLAAIQTVVNAALRKLGEGPRVIIDIEGYRSRRFDSLEQLARRAAERATSSGRAVALGPMNSYERRIIHLALKDIPNISTESEGEEPDREVVVVPK